MTAKEANAIARTKILNEQDSQFAGVTELIEKAARKGDFKCLFYNRLLPAVFIELESRGFKIESCEDIRDHSVTVTISWQL